MVQEGLTYLITNLNTTIYQTEGNSKWNRGNQGFILDHRVGFRSIQGHSLGIWSMILYNMITTNNILQTLWEVQGNRLLTINTILIHIIIKWAMPIKIDFSIQMKQLHYKVVVQMISWIFIHKICLLKCYL